VDSLVEENTDNKKHVQIFYGKMLLKVVFQTSEKDVRMRDIKPFGPRILLVKEFHEVEDKYGVSGMILTGINQNT